MSLAGKISSEIRVHATAAKWFNLFATQLHHVQNLTDRVHGTKLHHGEDWHHNESIKHWTCTIDGKVTTYHESIESIDEASKTITYKVFGEDFDHKFKVLKVIFQAIHEEQGGSIIKWIIEYETSRKLILHLASSNSCTKEAEMLMAIFSRHSSKSYEQNNKYEISNIK